MVRDHPDVARVALVARPCVRNLRKRYPHVVRQPLFWHVSACGIRRFSGHSGFARLLRAFPFEPAVCSIPEHVSFWSTCKLPLLLITRPLYLISTWH